MKKSKALVMLSGVLTLPHVCIGQKKSFREFMQLHLITMIGLRMKERQPLLYLGKQMHRSFSRLTFPSLKNHQIFMEDDTGPEREMVDGPRIFQHETLSSIPSPHTLQNFLILNGL